MNTRPTAFLLAAALTAATVGQAQTPKPPTGSGDPSAASTPHQRDATDAKSSESRTGTSPEAAAASSPHQREATGKSAGASDSALKMAHADGMVPTKFAQKAALDGMTEVEAGKLALAKSQDPKVREFAQRMVTDHGKANEQLASIAKSKGLQIPKALDSEHKAMLQSLNAKSGAAFDAAYSEHMATAHAKAVALFEGASGSPDADLAGFAKKTLPTLEEHKEMADALSGTRTAEAGTGARKE